MLMAKKTEMIKQRLQALRQGLASAGGQGYLACDVNNVRYLTGFSGHDSWALVTKRGIVLLTDSRYTEQAAGQCAGVRIVERTGPMADAVAKELQRYKTLETVLVDAMLPVGAFAGLKKALRKAAVKCKAKAGIVQQVRRKKDDTEARYISRAAKIAWDALDMALGEIKPGMTESQLRAKIDYGIISAGSEPSFETIVAFGPNGSRPHHQAGGRKLKKGDPILIDFGARYNGYASDTTRCFVLGKPRREYSKAWVAVLAAQQCGIKMIKPGIKTADVDQAVRAVIQESGFPEYGHGTGHGLGLDVHETPVLSSRSKETLEVGDVVTVEPGIYLPGKFGIRIEDDVLVTPKGAKILSKSRQGRFHHEKIEEILL